VVRSGLDLLTLSSSHFDPMYGPAARCKRFRQPGRLRSCINVSGLCLERVVLRAIMDISAHAISLADRPPETGHLGHQCSHAPGRPILHRRLILSQTSAGKLSYVIDSSSSCLRCSFVRAWRPFLRPGLRVQDAPRAGGRQGWPSRRPHRSRPCCPGHALYGPEHGARITLDGTPSHPS
jgi:hypothetical protein